MTGGKQNDEEIHTPGNRDYGVIDQPHYDQPGASQAKHPS